MENCPACGNPIGDGAAYCGACGKRIVDGYTQTLYTVHNYHIKYAKENGAHMTFGKIFGRSLLLMVPAIVMAIICPIVFIGTDLELVGSMVIPIVFALLGIAGIVIHSAKMSKYTNAQFTSYVYDKRDGTYYSVCFHGNQVNGWDAASRAASAVYNYQVREQGAAFAHNDALCIQVVEEWKKGFHRPSFWGSNALSVIQMKDVRLICADRRHSKIEFTDMNGNRKTKVIPNAYKTLYFGGTHNVET